MHVGHNYLFLMQLDSLVVQDMMHAKRGCAVLLLCLSVPRCDSAERRGRAVVLCNSESTDV